jgi:hypothetical protein
VTGSPAGDFSDPQRVIQWGAGNTGGHSLRFLIEDPAFEVAGVWVSREQNVGRSAGELAGLAAEGPAATNSIDDIVDLDADCVVYMAAEPNGPPNQPGTDGWDSVATIPPAGQRQERRCHRYLRPDQSPGVRRRGL